MCINTPDFLIPHDLKPSSKMVRQVSPLAVLGHARAETFRDTSRDKYDWVACECRVKVSESVAWCVCCTATGNCNELAGLGTGGEVTKGSLLGSYEKATSGCWPGHWADDYTGACVTGFHQPLS